MKTLKIDNDVDNSLSDSLYKQFSNLAESLSDAAGNTKAANNLLLRLREIEFEISSQNDIDSALSNNMFLLRWIIDLITLVKGVSRNKEMEVESLYAIYELKVRADYPKATISEVKSRILNDYADYVEEYQKSEDLKSFLEHLRELRQIVFMRKDVFVERSIDRRSMRKEEREAI